MVSSLIICGTNSFSREEDEEDHDGRSIRSAGSSPRKLSSRSKTHNKNPYSTRGLDKFSALLAEIEEKRQRIYSEMNPDEISFVRFDYSKDNNCKPIVVKSKADQTQNKKNKSKDKPEAIRGYSSGPLDRHGHSQAVLDPPMVAKERSRGEVGPAMPVQKRRLNLERLRRPQYYLPVVVMVILIFLALFGRSVAIMCTSIGWYLIPTISNGSSNLRRKSFKKKSLVGHQGGVSSFKGVNHGTSSSS